AAERIRLAELCQRPYKQLFVAAARFYADAFAAEPKLLTSAEHRYNAARAAALAGCGQGDDAGPLKDEDRDRLRRQALTWLRADLEARRQQLDKASEAVRTSLLSLMQRWQQDAAFTSVRDAEGLAKLSKPERIEWEQLWADVEALRHKCA